MRASITTALCASLLLAACGEGRDAEQDAKTPAAGDEATIGDETTAADDAPPLGPLGGNVTPSAYKLDLALDPDLETYAGTVAIDISVAQETSRIWFHGKDLTVSEVYAELGDGTRVDATYEEVDVTGVASLDFAEKLPAGLMTLHASYEGVFTNNPSGIYRTEEGGDHYAGSQFEPIDARRVFPGFDDPRFKTPYDITITTKAGDHAITVSPEASSEDLEDGAVRHVFETTDPIPAYLLAFAIGPYDIVEWTPIPANAVRQTPLPLRGIAPKGKGGRLDYALKNTVDMIEMMEAYFDTPYPYAKLDIIAPPDFFGGAMENVGAIMYNEYFLLLDENSGIDQRRLHEFIHAHELAHQWFGNYVTPAWWDDVWLNESFTSWMHYKISAEHWPEGQFDRGVLTDGLSAMTADSLANAKGIRRPILNNATIGDAFSGSITYQKGGAVLAMFETYLGEDAFREGVRTHMRRFPHGTATADDFMQSMADGSGRPEVIPAFRSFIDQPGIPLLSARVDCAGAPELKLSQSRYAPLGSSIDVDQTWQVPVCAAYGSASGEGSACGLVDEKEISLPLNTDMCPAYVVPNGDGSGYFRFALDEAGWAALAQAGTNLSAAQALVYADSLDAAFRADAASADALLDGVSVLAGHDVWDAVTAALDQYEALVDIAPDEEGRANIEALGRKIFRPVYEGLGDANDAQSILLRTSLTRFMAIVVLDPDVRAELLVDARRYVGMDGNPDPGAIAPDLVATVLSVGVQEDGLPFFDKLLDLVIASDDAAVRGPGIGALARTEDAVLSKRLLDTLLNDERFSANEMGGGYNRQLARNKTRVGAWEWTKDNLDALTERFGGAGSTRFLAGVGSSFCSATIGADFEKVMHENSEDYPGYETVFARTMERIDLCVALVGAKGQEFADAAAARL